MEKGKMVVRGVLFAEIRGVFFCIFSGFVHHCDIIFHTRKAINK